MKDTQTVKICRVCLDDCSSRPRVREPDGQYICRDCFDMEQATAGPSRTTRQPQDGHLTEPSDSMLEGSDVASAIFTPLSESQAAYADDDNQPFGSSISNSPTPKMPAPDEVSLYTGQGAAICPSCHIKVDVSDVVCTACGESLSHLWADPEAGIVRSKGIFAKRGIRHPTRWGILGGLLFGALVWAVLDPDHKPVVGASAIIAGGLGGAILIWILTKVTIFFDEYQRKQQAA